MGWLLPFLYTLSRYFVTTWHHVQIISPIVTFSSELLQISSELVLFSSEPVSRISELLIINAFKITTIPHLAPHQSPAMPRSAILNSFTYIQIQTPNKTHFVNHTRHTTNPNNAPWTPKYRKNKDKCTTPYKKMKPAIFTDHGLQWFYNIEKIDL